MTETDMEAFRSDAAKMGERTRAYVIAETTHDGLLHWRYGGGLVDAVFVYKMLGRFIDMELDKATAPKTDATS